MHHIVVRPLQLRDLADIETILARLIRGIRRGALGTGISHRASPAVRCQMVGEGGRSNETAIPVVSASCSASPRLCGLPSLHSLRPSPFSLHPPPLASLAS